jgi:circadian clock protein KaiB
MVKSSSNTKNQKPRAERSGAPASSRVEKAPASTKARARSNGGSPPATGEYAGKDESIPGDTWTLRLYVAGDTPKSRTALANLQRLCEAHLSGKKYEIEVIDLKTRPELAKAHQILALPTLIRKVPEPVKRVIGDLSNADRTLIGLELA